MLCTAKKLIMHVILQRKIVYGVFLSYIWYGY